MKFDELPVEIIKPILWRVDLSPIHAICKEFPKNPFTQVLESILYEKIYYGPRNLDKEFVLVSIGELYRLARGEIKASVQCLRICADTTEGIDSGFYDLLELAETHRLLLEAIPDVEFEGYNKCLLQYASRVSIANIHRWKLFQQGTLDLNYFPPKLREFELNCYDTAQNAANWPNTLITMVINCRGKALGHSTSIRFPKGLRKLHLIKCPTRFNNDLANDLLTELRMEDCDLSWTSFLISLLNLLNLKVLDLKGNPIREFRCDRLPSIEVLNLSNCLLSSIANIQFPSLLKVLYLQGNAINSFESSGFPSLTFLDISCDNGREDFLSKVKFPSTLVTLFTRGRVVGDWSITQLPSGLKKLALYINEDPRSILFPLMLESLEVQFPTSSTTKYSSMRLPRTLLELKLENGVADKFYWNLPDLQSFTVHNLKGTLEIPEAEIVTIIGKDPQYFRKLVIPDGVVSLTLSYTVEKYPSTLKVLKIIYPRTFKESWIPRSLEKLLVGLGNGSTAIFRYRN